MKSRHEWISSPAYTLIALIGVIVPRRLRSDWRLEWEAELRAREALLAEWDRLDWRSRLDLLLRSIGAFRDALWLQTYRWEDEMIQDLRFGVRMLTKQPLFTLTAVATLALGIGANTAIFSLVNAVLLNPLPYENPARLMMVWESHRESARDREGISPGNYLDLRQQTAIFDSVTAWFETARTLQGEHDAEQVNSAQVSVEFFHTLRAQAALGRVFLPGETTGVANDGAGQYTRGDRVVVVSAGLWRRRFGADEALVGRTIRINGQDWQVIGVMPDGFAMPDQGTDLWMPWDIRQTYGAARFAQGPPRDWRFMNALARLRPEVTVAQAQAQLDSFTSALDQLHPGTNRGWGMNLTSFTEEIVGASRPPLLMLSGAVLLALLIACANVAGLLLARASARQREIAVRSALGASRARLLRQLLTESLALALAGGAAGLALAWVCRDLLVSLAPADVPGIDQVAIDGRVLVFTLVVSLVTGIVFGLAPALKGTRTDINATLREGGARNTTAGAGQQRFLRTLVVAEIAVALMLLVGAGLFARSFVHLLRADPGFETKNLLTMHIMLDGPAYRGRSAAYYRQLIERLEALPGVVSAAAVSTLPMSSVGVDFDRPYWRAGDPEPGGEADKVDIRMATPGYFRTMGMPLLKGRPFTDQDRSDTPAVIIVSESMAARVWPGEDPVGKRLMLDYNRGKYSYEVVGVTRGISYKGLKSPQRPELFIPHAQNPYLPMNVVIRTETDPAQFIAGVRAELHALDPLQPAHNIVTMERLVADSLALDRFALWLLGLFSLLALILSATGIYGVMAYGVSQRTHEFGVRMALGAQASEMTRLVLRQGLKLTLAGVAVGVAGALALTQLLRGMLYGVSATDPLTFAVIALLLTGVALLACYLPARRAMKVDPLVALRHE